MLVSCWSTKGGTGTTVVAAALALSLARSSPDGAVLADLAGDAPLALGVTAGPGPGLAEWLAAAPDVPADGLARVERPVAAGLTLLPRGSGPLERRTAALLAGLLDGDARPVVADCGCLRSDGGADAAALVVAGAASRSLAVVRPCFLALHRMVQAPVRASGIVLVAEEGRALSRRDVEAALHVPVVARVRHTEAVARAVDAGLLSARLPRTLDEDLRDAA